MKEAIARKKDSHKEMCKSGTKANKARYKNISGSRGKVEGVATPPPWEIFELVWLLMSVPFSHQKNIINSCFM